MASSASSSSIPGWATPQRLLQLSALVAVCTIVLKTLAWTVSGSVGLLSDAVESLVNLAAALFGLGMVVIARRPADESHPYGHGKAEYFSSGFEGLMILAAAAAIVWASARRLLHPQPLDQLGWGMALSVVSSALNGALAWLMRRAGRVHRSMALEADARHLIVDVWTSAGVIGGLLAVLVTGWLWLDALIALAVGLNILREGGRLVWSSSQGLMDESLDAADLHRLQAAIDAFCTDVSGAQGDVHIDHLSTRRAGQRSFAELHLHLPANWSLARADQLRIALEAALMRAVPGAVVSIALLPQGAVTAFEKEASGK